MHPVARNLLRALGRIFPDCVTLSQAIAFNMFLAFFPMLLFALGVLSNTSLFHAALKDIPEHLSRILPPGSSDVVTAYFARKGVHTWRWISLGLGGTLLAGSQVMLGFMDGIRIIEGDLLRPAYWRMQVRAVLLLCLTVVPVMAVIVLTVFGKSVRPWLIRYTGLPGLVRGLGFLVWASVVFVLAMGVLVTLYRIGRPGHRGYASLLPGAAVATVLWWAADIVFGLYVGRMPYNLVYGGLAAAIGLLLWMYLTAIVVLIGAAYNAEAREAAIESANEGRRARNAKAIAAG
jgi:membrane protein